MKNFETLSLESQLLRGFEKYITLGVFRDIRFKFFSRLGNVNLLKVLGNTWGLQRNKDEASFQN